MSELIRILCIDGGGIKGILPSQILLKLERILRQKTGNSNARIADYFDFIAGTSTGGILSCIYLCPHENNAKISKFSAEDAVDFYVEYGPLIFKSSFLNNISSMLGMLKPRFSVKTLEKHLAQLFGNTKLSQVLKPCLIAAYNIEERYEHFFTRHDAVQNPDYDFYLRDVARATSAAPIYFGVSKINSMAQTSFPLVDGGIFANNPSMCSYTEICKEYEYYKDHKKLKAYPSAEDMIMLSLGTGENHRTIPYSKSKNWGAIQWALPIIDVLMSVNTSTIHVQLETVFKSINKPHQYIRINPHIPYNMAKLDNVSQKNISDLLKKGYEVAIQYEEKLNEVADILISKDMNLIANGSV